MQRHPSDGDGSGLTKIRVRDEIYEGFASVAIRLMQY